MASIRLVATRVVRRFEFKLENGGVDDVSPGEFASWHELRLTVYPGHEKQPGYLYHRDGACEVPVLGKTHLEDLVMTLFTGAPKDRISGWIDPSVDGSMLSSVFIQPNVLIPGGYIHMSLYRA